MAAERNKRPIFDVLKQYLPTGTGNAVQLLEIASGIGTHMLFFTEQYPNVSWHPSELDTECLASIKARLASEAAAGRPRPLVAEPLQVDVSKPVEHWPAALKGLKGQMDFMLTVNLLHISPWDCSLGLFSGAGEMLRPSSGQLFIYGPFAQDGVLTPRSNVEFDSCLKMNNPDWGIRDIRDLETEAAREQLHLVACHEMPANNKILVFAHN